MPRWLLHLNAWSLVELSGKDEGGMALLEEVYHLEWALRLQKPLFSLPVVYRSGCRALGYCYSALLVYFLPW